MTGSDFVRAFANKGLVAWEAAALEEARRGGLVPWPFVDLTLQDDQGNTATIKVASDVLAVGTLEDHVRLPLTPSRAQDILNLTGALLPTPWLVYQTWRAAPIKIQPVFLPIQQPTLLQYAKHDALVDAELELFRRTPDQLAAGIEKSIVVSNIWKPNRVVIFGWYQPQGPDVFDDKQPMGTAGRQPVQPLSNVHAADYVDYSHGVRAVGSECVVNGQRMGTAELYRHPTLSRLVSNEGPVRVLRYPSTVAATTNLPPPIGAEEQTVAIVRDQPSMSELGFNLITGVAGEQS